MNRRKGPRSIFDFHSYRDLKFRQDIARRQADERLRTKTNAEYILVQGKTFGIICPKYDRHLISVVMQHLKECGIPARFKKLHRKGKGFIGFRIERTNEPMQYRFPLQRYVIPDFIKPNETTA